MLQPSLGAARQRYPLAHHVLPTPPPIAAAGCTGSLVSRPGSRFLRHKAPREQQGGITDASLLLLARRRCASPLQQPQPQQTVAVAAAEGAAGGQPEPSAAAAAAAAAGTGLQALNLSGLSITDSALGSFSGLTNLQLRFCKRIGDSGLLQLLANCPGLARLDAAGCSQLTAAGFGCYTPFGSSQQAAEQQEGCGAASEQQDLEQLLLPFRQVVSTAMGVQLQRAGLPRQACTREVLAWLAGQASSTSSSSGGDWAIGRDSSAAGSSRPPGCSPLQRLELASGSALADADLLALAACCPQLKSLQMGAAGAAASPRMCAGLAQHCRLLTRLVISASGLMDGELTLLLRALPGLQHLELGPGCSGITGAAFKQWHAELEAQWAAEAAGSSGPATGASAASMSALQSLRLDGSSFDDSSASGVAAACPHLEVLSLRQCRWITGVAAVALLASCRNLRQLQLGGTRAAQPCSAPLVDALFAAAAAGTPCHSLTFRGSLPFISTTPPARPRPSALTLVELPVVALDWAPKWRELLSLVGSPKLVFRDAGG